MHRDESLPSHDKLFGELDVPIVDEARSVYSPAAYLADLLQLAEDCATGVPEGAERLGDRRPDLARVLLDARASFTEVPYLDIVNEVLGERVGGGADPFARLAAARYPFLAPFSLAHERLRQCLRELGVDPVELYRRFAPHAHPDVVAREHLGLTAAEVTMVTTALDGGQALREQYNLGGGEAFDALADADRFRRTAGLTQAELRELVYGELGAGERDAAAAFFVHQGGEVVSLDADERRLVSAGGTGPVPVAWFDRANRFIRLARRTGMSFVELDRVLRACAGNRLDLAAVRALAVVSHLRRELDLPVDVVASLVAPIETLGVGDAAPADLFNRVFNVPFAALEGTVLRGPGMPPPDYAGLAELRCTGDILAPVNAEYRRRVGAAVGLAAHDLAAAVTRARERGPAGLFGRTGAGLAELSLLHRVGRLTAALDISVTELFALLDVLDSDPSMKRYTTFPLLVDSGASNAGGDLVLAGAEGPDAGLWLVQTLLAVVRWMRATGLTATDLAGILGGAAGEGAEDRLLLDGLRARFEAIAPAAAVFGSERFGERAAQVIRDVIADAAAGAGRGGSLLRVDPPLREAAARTALAELSAVAANDFLGLGLGDRLAAKAYTNLTLAGYLGEGGAVAVERVPATPAEMRLRGDFAAYQDMLFDLVGKLCEGSEQPAFYPSDLASLAGMSEAERTELYDNLVHNGYLTSTGEVLDPGFFATIGNRTAFAVDADVADLADGVHALLLDLAGRSGALAPEDLHGLADAAAAQRVADRLAARHLRDGRLTEEAAALVADPDAALGLDGFTATENATIAHQLRVILADGRPYRVDPAALTALGFTDDERRRLLAQLVEAGHLTEALGVAPQRLAYFAHAPHAADFGLPGLVDFRVEIFHLLHAAATETVAGTAHITGVLERLATAQHATLVEYLREGLGVPAATVQAICAAVAGDLDRALDVLVEPLLADPAAVADDPYPRRALRRMRGFARFATTVGLDADQVTLAFRDQDLTGKYPEPLALPPGADRIDALLESADGNVYVFHGGDVWVYSAATHVLLDDRPRSLADLSPALGQLATVDTAFADAAGAEWIVGRDGEGVPHTFVREPGRPRWLRRVHEWGVVANAFDGARRIDAAFVDEGGRTYLFHRDQYVRYAGDDHEYVDEGYPRQIVDWAETERRTAPLPERFRTSLDAAFHGLDGTTYLFAGDSFLPVRDGAVAQPIAGTWGTTANALAGAERVDATYVDGPALYVFAGNQVARYTAGIESAGVRVDDGYPRRIDAHLEHVPAEFDGGVEAAFADDAHVVHLFKDGRTVALDSANPAVVATASRWGHLPPALPEGTVDAALAGVDGHTYLFSGETYIRYSGTDYSTVDLGYPRRIDGDWAGLRRVDAAFVQDGATFLFGAAGLLFDVSIGHRDEELDAGRLPRDLRQRLLAHGVTVADGAPVTGQDPLWQVTAEDGIALRLLRVDEDRLEVRCDPATEMAFHVRYSTPDYAVPDPGYPRPMSDNWWNLPEDLVEEGAAFARVDAVLTGRDNRTYLFSGGQFLVFDNKRRWWSEPRTLEQHWDSLPFDSVDAAFVGTDGRTYLFHRGRYARYSTADYTRLDDRYPAAVTPFWGKVANNLARTGRVDAVLVLDGEDGARHTYLFSGDQFIRYTGAAAGATADIGYPRALSALSQEPRLGNLRVSLPGVSAAFADRGSVYLFSGDTCHVVSESAHRRYDDLAQDVVGCAYVDDGEVCVEHPGGWYRYSALEGTAVARGPVRPRSLRRVPASWRTGLDAVLRGVDGNTYLFQGTSCYNADLGREYPLAEEWGRPRNTIFHDSAVDAAFVGTDGRTYVFRDDQFVVYAGDTYLDAEVEGDARPVAEHWGGLTRVALAYVRDGVTHLFEPADATGAIRYVTYSGADYSRPDHDRPRTTDASFWEVPERDRPAGFTMPTAVLASGTSTLLLIGEDCLAHNDAAGTWSAPRPIARIWPGTGRLDALTTAFTGRDGATYFFDGEEFIRHDGRSAAAREPIRARWARTRNNFLARTGEDIVDAALVHRGVTFLFSGDQYVRYSGPDYRYADPGYPKQIVGNIRSEQAFAALPAEVEDDLAERFAAGGRAMVDAAVADERTVYLFVDRTCHAVSGELAAAYDIARLGQVRNNVAERGRVDAALVLGEHTYLFSGDQYVRYTGGDYGRADDAHPRTIAAGLPGELGVPALPEAFHDGLDAAFETGDGRTILFAGEHVVSIKDGAVTPGSIEGWGTVQNDFRAERAGLDAAFVAATGELYAFAGSQYVRYAPLALDTVEPGYPRRIEDSWGDLPDGFEQRVDGAFRFAGRTYLAHGDEYVRYSGDGYGAVDGTYPQPFRHRWTDAADYRLSDLRTIARFAELARAHPDSDGGLATFLLPDPRVVADPYRHLADLFGWDAGELKWCRRNSRLFTGMGEGGPDGADGDRLELEFLAALSDVFALAARLGTPPSQVHAALWSPLHRDGDAGAAADALHTLLARRTGAERWPALARRLHDELNLRKRDVLVAAVLGDSGETSRDLFVRHLLDVDMGARGTTSRIREAIAAAQLFIHRYLLGLELAGGDEATRRRVKQWWAWMRNYRVWEANRRAFLYPENVLRPELRPTKTNAFHALEDELLRGEITAEGVENAYRRYLDEYTEVSRLAIAGGYVYTKDQLPDGPRRLVLFGRTRTAPRRYYHRRAEFADRAKLSASWEPWQPVDVRIDADHVHPVHAFGRVFVFWAVPEAVTEDDPNTTSVVARSAPDGQVISGRGRAQRIRIHYSFQNLNQQWVPAQTLGTGVREEGTISGATLLLLPRMKTADQMSIVVSCAYTVTAKGEGAAEPTTPTGKALFELNPELYAEDLLATGDAATETAALVAEATALEADRTEAAAERVARIFVDPVGEGDVVRFDAPAGSDLWFSVDHKGGSFLCRAAAVEPLELVTTALAPNGERLPDRPAVDAAVELPSGDRYFFDNTANTYLHIGPPPAAGEALVTGGGPIAPRWGRVPSPLTAAGTVDSVLFRGDQTFVFSGETYVRFTGVPFGDPDAGYPRPLRDNPDTLPRWERLDVAFTAPNGVEYFLDNAGDRLVTSADLAAAAAAAAAAEAEGKTPEPVATRSVAAGLWPRSGKPEQFGTVDAAVVTEKATYLISGQWYVRFWRRTGGGGGSSQQRKVLPLAPNNDDLPTDFTISAGVWRDGRMYYFGDGEDFYEIDRAGNRVTRPTYGTTALAQTQDVDAAWATADHLYLTTGAQYVRYTLDGGTVPYFVDPGYPEDLPVAVEAAFRRDSTVYLFAGDGYTHLGIDQEPADMGELRAAAGAWGDLPGADLPPFDAALTTATDLYLFHGGGYVRYPKTVGVNRPYEHAALPFEMIRLTTGTASTLNRRLLAGGLPALLALSTQETDEVAVTTDETATSAIRVRPELVDANRLPTGSHLDFGNANGLYYWEIFFHAPLLIAQALNGAQRFEDARRWYEYVFDPTNPGSYWRFLPFLAVDPRALAAALDHDLDRLSDVDLPAGGVATALGPVVDALRALAPALAQNRDPATERERLALATVTGRQPREQVDTAVAALVALADLTAAQRDALAALQEHLVLLAELVRQLDLAADRDALLKVYRDNPFDPYAVADLRPVAYRRAVVMGYVDNLLDWADLLFRQYTPESVDEARMLYMLAHDLLGERPERLGTQLRPPSESFAELAAGGDLDLVGFFTAGGTMTTGGGSVHAGVANAYFQIPENTLFEEYWTRIEDRLRKIRQSLDIMGIGQPLPLFAPPIDPLALVRGAAAGNGLDLAAASTPPAVPHYRFAFTHRRAQELVDKLRQFGSDLLGVLERASAEELSLLQGRQEREIRALTRDVKQAQISVAEQNHAELTVSLAEARARSTHYENLIATGMTQLEHAQLDNMSSAVDAHLAASVLKVAAGISYAVPQFYVGPFIIGTDTGGRQLGDSIDKASEVSESLGEMFSMLGEVLGIQAQHARTAEDWELQLATAQSDAAELGHRITGAVEQVRIARQEAEILEREIAHGEAVATFLKDKFTNAELYGWMAASLSGLYFQAYHLAYEMARAAEQAYRFERGLTAGEATSFIRPAHWQSRRNGLLAGDGLWLDLERLGKAHLDAGGRGLEITRQVSLRALDPIALLRLRDGGRCEFALTEALFDHDFPGHYRRQLRTVTVTFADADGQPLGVNAMLTQLAHKTVLEADPQAVRHLLDPQGAPPASVRGDLRAGQQIALSQPDGGRENNGLFDARFDDDRYLPFEGTGAVSRWSLDHHGRPVRGLFDVVFTVKYTAEQGGEAFANAVRSMLRPRPAARLFDLARDFPQEWSAFLSDGDGRLVLPLTAEMFPDLASQQVTGVYATYERADGTGTRLLLGGDPAMALPEGQLLPTPGRTLASPGWMFTVDGPKEDLRNVGLALTYQARTL